MGHIGSAAIRVLKAEGVTSLLLVGEPDRGEPDVLSQLGLLPRETEVTLRDSSALAEETWLEGADVCLLAEDSVQPARCLAVNNRCLTSAVPLLPGLAMGPVAQVGPRIVGGHGPCLECIDTRVRVNVGRPALVGHHPADSTLAQAVGERLARLALERESVPDHTMWYWWKDGRVTEHQVLRVPTCRACGALDPRPAFSGPTPMKLEIETPDPGRICSLEPLIVDEVTGLVRWVTSYPPGEGEPSVSHAVASVAHPGWEGTGQELYSGGSDLDPDKARAAALGEALDRLATVSPLPEQLRLVTYEEIADDAVDPASFDLFHPATRQRTGFPYSTVERGTPISWVWSWSLAHDRPAMVPAARVFAPFSPSTPADEMDITNVSGCATGSTAAEAVLSGLLEVVERDTFMIAWASQLPVAGLRLLPDSPGEVGLYATAFGAVGVEVRCATVTLDWGVPVVFAIAHSHNSGDPSAVVAAAADLDVTTACRRALKELTANLAYARHAMASMTGPTSADASQVRTQEDHLLLYARPEMWHHLERWWSPTRNEELCEVERCSAAEALARIQARVADSGSDVLVVDVSHHKLRDRGLHTLKVLVPGAYPMNFDSLWPHHGGRILQVPCDVGLLAEPLEVSDLNPTPHPFP